MSGALNGKRNAARMLSRVQPLLVTGGAGFIGCNLVDRLATAGHHVIVLDNLGRRGVERNLEWLTRRHGSRIKALITDVRGQEATDAVRDCAGVFHLAAQVAVTTSFEDALQDLDINVRATVALLEAVARRPAPPPFIFASTNKVYGDLGDVALEKAEQSVRPRNQGLRRCGISEDRPLAFHTPYGCSKGAADQYVLDFARTRRVPGVVLRMSCVYGPHQYGSVDQGWVAHFLKRAVRNEPVTIFGDGCQVRDVLHVEDAVEAFVRAWQHADRIGGRAFNLGGGPANAISLLQLIDHIGKMQSRKPDVKFAPARPCDQRWYVSDTRRIAQALALPPARLWRDGLQDLANWMMTTQASPSRRRSRTVADAGSVQ